MTFNPVAKHAPTKATSSAVVSPGPSAAVPPGSAVVTAVALSVGPQNVAAPKTLKAHTVKPVSVGASASMSISHSLAHQHQKTKEADSKSSAAKSGATSLTATNPAHQKPVKPTLLGLLQSYPILKNLVKNGLQETSVKLQETSVKLYDAFEIPQGLTSEEVRTLCFNLAWHICDNTSGSGWLQAKSLRRDFENAITNKLEAKKTLVCMDAFNKALIKAGYVLASTYF
jgi:hypothetical protein